MQKDLISLIIPCYNVAPYLNDTFLSIKSQSYQFIEPIFVDDGSTDNTAELIKNFIKEYPKAKLIQQKNSGISTARNTAIKNADGEYLYIFDPDDAFHPDTLKILHHLITKENADVSIVKFKKVNESFSYLNKRFSEIKIKKVRIFTGSDAITSQYISSNIFVHAPWNKLFRHEIVKKFPSYPDVFQPDCLFLEDVPFCAEYFSHSIKAVYLPKTLYYFRQRKNSNTHSNFNPKKLTVYNGWIRYKNINPTDFPEAQTYIKMKYCIDDLLILFRIAHSDYENSELIREIYNRYKENLKFCFKSKRCQWYRKYLIWTSKPFIYLMVRKKMKN